MVGGISRIALTIGFISTGIAVVIGVIIGGLLVGGTVVLYDGSPDELARKMEGRSLQVRGIEGNKREARERHRSEFGLTPGETTRLGGAQNGGVLVRAGHTEAGCDLAQLAGTDHHQGVAVRMEPFAYAELDELLARQGQLERARGRHPGAHRAKECRCRARAWRPWWRSSALRR